MGDKEQEGREAGETVRVEIYSCVYSLVEVFHMIVNTRQINRFSCFSFYTSGKHFPGAGRTC